MNYIFLPAWTLLLGVGWLAGRYWDQLLAWIERFLEDDTLPHAPVLEHPSWRARRHLRVVDRPFDQDNVS